MNKAVFFFLLLFSLAACEKASDFETRVIPFEVIAKSVCCTTNQETAQKNEAITNQGAWENFLETLSSPPQNIEIDFTNDMVLAVVDQIRSTGGYDVEIIEVKELENKIEVDVEYTAPRENDIVSQALTQPYHIIKIEKQSKSFLFK